MSPFLPCPHLHLPGDCRYCYSNSLFHMDVCFAGKHLSAPEGSPFMPYNFCFGSFSLPLSCCWQDYTHVHGAGHPVHRAGPLRLLAQHGSDQLLQRPGAYKQQRASVLLVAVVVVVVTGVCLSTRVPQRIYFVCLASKPKICFTPPSQKMFLSQSSV